MKETPITFEEGLQLGDYILKAPVSQQDDREIWLGEQLSVKREVEVVCYYGDDSEGFLADARVKAKVEDGVLGLVYEAVEFEGFTALVREVLTGMSLETILGSGVPLKPIQMTRMLSQIAGSLEQFDQKELARETLLPEDIHYDEQGRVRLRNIASAGAVRDDMETRRVISHALGKTLEYGQPGSTRMGTLLSYIEGTDSQSPISWTDVKQLATQVDEQLTAAEVTVTRSEPMVVNRGLGPKTMIAAVAVALMMVGVGIWAINKERKPTESNLKVLVKAGRFPRPNGGLVELKPFRIDADEVTIGEYAEFLKAWNKLSPKEQLALYPSTPPDEKRTARPTRWTEFYNAARGKKKLEGREFTLDSAVAGVDWWDAMAYAKWKGGTLPSEQQWWAAATLAKSEDESSSPMWTDTVAKEGELHGFSNNVSEWVRDRTKNPAFPMKPRLPVVLGSSFAGDTKGALQREWLESQMVRREDIGFRVAYRVEQ